MAVKMRKYGVALLQRLNTDYQPCRNIAEQLIEKGLAGVVRHKRDDEDRSPDYDKLMAAEQA
ncbi:hypothetical protein MPER_15737, partial [Moniliophthora perniciosa FA553]